MDSNPDFKVLAVLDIDGLEIVLAIKSKISNSNRMMAVEKSTIYLALCLLQSSTGHIGLANCFYFMKPILITKLVKSVIYLIQKL